MLFTVCKNSHTYLIRGRESQLAKDRQVDGDHDDAAESHRKHYQPILGAVVINLCWGA